MSNRNVIENSEILMSLRDKDIFPNTPDMVDAVFEDRLTGKIVLFNEEGKIALVGNKVNDFFILPGGGVEEGESVLNGMRRECREETGIQEALGVTEDFRSRDGKHCISFCYSAKVVSLGAPMLTEGEAKIGVYVKWFSLPEAIELFALQEEKVKAGEVKFYNTCFNIMRDSFFIRHYESSNFMTFGG